MDGRWLLQQSATASFYNLTTNQWTTSTSVLPNGTTYNYLKVAAVTKATGVPDGSSLAFISAVDSLRNATFLYRVDYKTGTNLVVSTQTITSQVDLVWLPAPQQFLLISAELQGIPSFFGTEIAADTTSANKAFLNSPTGRRYPCLASAYNGTKVVYFGGEGIASANGASVTQSDIYILDVPSGNWTRGPDVDAGNARSSVVCGVSGDYLIVWGGLKTTGSSGITPPDFMLGFNSTLLFNLKTMSWTTDFVPPTQPPKSTSATVSSTSISSKTNSASPTHATSPPNPNDGPRVNIVVILASVAAVLILLLLVFTGYIFRARLKRFVAKYRQESLPPSPSTPPQPTSFPYDYGQPYWSQQQQQEYEMHQHADIEQYTQWVKEQQQQQQPADYASQKILVDYPLQPYSSGTSLLPAAAPVEPAAESYADYYQSLIAETEAAALAATTIRRPQMSPSKGLSPQGDRRLRDSMHPHTYSPSSSENTIVGEEDDQSYTTPPMTQARSQNPQQGEFGARPTSQHPHSYFPPPPPSSAFRVRPPQKTTSSSAARIAMEPYQHRDPQEGLTTEEVLDAYSAAPSPQTLPAPAPALVPGHAPQYAGVTRPGRLSSYHTTDSEHQRQRGRGRR
ncbi:hypothetical protein BGZ98_010225 [Dissophora globulifera]|nr:hypothetical protein BGZ98_010225 [Dissophora globulifera]